MVEGGLLAVCRSTAELFIFTDFIPITLQWRVDIMFGLLAVAFVPQFMSASRAASAFPVLRADPACRDRDTFLIGWLVWMEERSRAGRWGGLMLTLILWPMSAF